MAPIAVAWKMLWLVLLLALLSAVELALLWVAQRRQNALLERTEEQVRVLSRRANQLAGRLPSTAASVLESTPRRDAPDEGRSASPQELRHAVRRSTAPPTTDTKFVSP